MKKLTFIFAALVMAAVTYAQQPFEGQMVMKVMNSYSEAFLGLSPQYYSGVDTIVVTIKGDAIHEYFKNSGLHKIYNDGKLYYYSDNIKEGFSMPERAQNMDGVKEERSTGQTRTALGQNCTVNKTLILLNTTTVEIESWLADNTYRISDRVLQLLYTDMCMRVYTEFGGKICMKWSLRNYNTGNLDYITQYAKGAVNKQQREALWGSTDKNASEMSMSQIFEVMSITEKAIDPAELQPATDIQITAISMDDNANTPPLLDKDTYIATMMANPMIAKQVKKGKMNLDEMYEKALDDIKKVQQNMDNNPNYQVAGLQAINPKLAESLNQAMEDKNATGGTKEDAAYNLAYYNSEKQLLLKNKQYLKEHALVTKEAEQPVAHDLDEDWNF